MFIIISWNKYKINIPKEYIDKKIAKDFIKLYDKRCSDYCLKCFNLDGIK
jgi:hypothetical protein